MERFYGEKPKMEWISIEKLELDHKYQRDVTGRRSRDNVKLIANNFCWEKLTPLVVTETDSKTYNIIDGQHRYCAAKNLGNIPELPCYIITKSDTQKQANTFMGINKNRVYTTPYDLYKAEIACGEPKAVACDNFCNKAGIIIPFTGYCSTPNMTLALQTIKKHISMHNDVLLNNAVQIIRKAFPNKVGQLKSDIINTLINLKVEYGAKIKEEDCIEALKSFDNVDTITAKAKELRALDGSLSFSKCHLKIFLSRIKEVRKQ